MISLTWEDVDARLSALPLDGEKVWGIPTSEATRAGLSALEPWQPAKAAAPE